MLPHNTALECAAGVPLQYLAGPGPVNQGQLGPLHRAELQQLVVRGGGGTVGKLEPGALAGLPVSNNVLTGLDTALPAPALTSLSLSHNFIRFLAPSVMSNSPELELDLSKNQVSALATDSLAGPAPSLATLDWI